MIGQLDADQVQEIIGFLIGSFCLGWCIGYLVSAYNKFIQKIAS